MKYPETVRPILQLSAASGVVGTLLGLGVSAYRSLPTHVYAVSVGANFAIASGVFLGRFNLYMTTPHPFPGCSCLIPRLVQPHSHTILASFPGWSSLILTAFCRVICDLRLLCYAGLRHILVTSLYSRQVLLPQHTSYISSATSGGATGAVTSIVSRQ